jgi:hypothetical protein
MFDNARKYAVENALPSYREFIDHYKNGMWGENQLLRKGINAAISLYHMREHLPGHLRPRFADLENDCPDYGLLRDIANVAKHYNITRNNPAISNANQLYEIMTTTYYADEQGEFTAPQLEVRIKLNNGGERDMAEVLYNIMSMWRDTLDDLGVVNLKSPTPLAPNQVLTREEAAQKNADMKITQGEAYRLQFQIFKYNYEKNKREPINLTGYHARFRVYSPPKEVEIEISIPELGIEFDYKVPLSKEQGIQYVTLKSDDERSLFTKAVIDSDKNFQENLQQEIINKVRTKKDTQQLHPADAG